MSKTTVTPERADMLQLEEVGVILANGARVYQFIEIPGLFVMECDLNGNRHRLILTIFRLGWLDEKKIDCMLVTTEFFSELTIELIRSKLLYKRITIPDTAQVRPGRGKEPLPIRWRARLLKSNTSI